MGKVKDIRNLGFKSAYKEGTQLNSKETDAIPLGFNIYRRKQRVIRACKKDSEGK